MKYITILFLGLFLTACSINEPRVSFGKKCDVTEDGTLISSSVWIYNKDAGLRATEEACPKEKE